MTPQFCLPAAGEAAPHHPSGQAGHNLPFPWTAPAAGGAGASPPSIAPLPGMGRELPPGGEGHGRHRSPSGAVAKEWGREEQRLLPAGRFTSSASPPRCGGPRSAGSAPYRPARSWLAPASPLTSVPAHAQARPTARPPPHIAAGRGGSAPVTARLPMAAAASPARPAPGLQGGAAGRLPEGRRVPSRPAPPGTARSCVGSSGLPGSETPILGWDLELLQAPEGRPWRGAGRPGTVALPPAS